MIPRLVVTKSVTRCLGRGLSMSSVISRKGRRFLTRTLHLAPFQGGESHVAPSPMLLFFLRKIQYFCTISYYSYVEKSAICGCCPKIPLDDDLKTPIVLYGTTEFGILNPVPSHGHIMGKSTSPTQQDGGWLSDDGHGIITKYLPDGEVEFCLKGRFLPVG